MQDSIKQGKKTTECAASVPHGVSSATPIETKAEVQGHALIKTVVECPHCNALNHVVADTLDTRAFECWKCDSVFYF